MFIANINPIFTAGKITEEISFDQRPLLCTSFRTPPADEELGKFVMDQLQGEGYCVLDDYIPVMCCTQMLNEIRQLDKTGRMTAGKLAGGRTSGVQMKWSLIVLFEVIRLLGLKGMKIAARQFRTT